MCCLGWSFLSVLFERNDAKAEAPVFWPPHAKRWLIGKDSDAGRDCGQEEKGMTEDEMAWWHHQPWWTWVWVDSESWWWTGRPGMLRFMGSQRVRHDWATELNWTESDVGWIHGCGTWRSRGPTVLINGVHIHFYPSKKVRMNSNVIGGLVFYWCYKKKSPHN